MEQRPIHVLLIDDDEDEFIVIRDMLAEARESCFRIDWAGTYETAITRMSEHIHDVYLVDYRLGARSGIDLVHECAKRSVRVPIILLTGFDNKDVDRDALSAGAADYLRKSEISSYLLERSIRYAIYRAQMKAQAISQDRMASIGLLASSLAHEIGTPLGVIRGRAEYLAMQVRHDPAINKNVEVILSQIDRVSGLIRSLLNLARGDMSEATGEAVVNRAVADVVELLAHEFRRHAIEVIDEIGGGPKLRVFGQVQKLHQVILNLAVNATHAIQKAKEEGRADGHKIRFFARDLGATWCVGIEDTGCGISDEEKPNLFRPFYSTKTNNVGTGLGLATSLWIVQSWGGAIEVESQRDKGTTILLILPKSS